MKPTRYAVYTVEGDGNPYDVAVTTDPRFALACLAVEEAKFAGTKDHAHGIIDVDNPERGDVQTELEEEYPAEVGK